MHIKFVTQGDSSIAEEEGGRFVSQVNLYSERTNAFKRKENAYEIEMHLVPFVH